LKRFVPLLIVVALAAIGSFALGGFVPLISNLLLALVWVRMGIIPLSVVSGFVVAMVVTSRLAKMVFFIGGFVVGWGLFLGTPTLNGAFLSQFGVSMRTQVLIEPTTWMYKDANGRAQRVSKSVFGAMLYPNGVYAGFSEPSSNQLVTVVYVPAVPGNAMILTNDDSPYARTVRCGSLEVRVINAQSAYEFARDDVGLKAQYRVALEGVIDAQCQVRSGRSYAALLRELER
jgi:MFS family permease